MYCPNCGSESTQGLNYCKQCGANLTLAVHPAEATTTARLSGTPLAIAVASIALSTAVVVLAGLRTVLSFVQNIVSNDGSGDLPEMILVLGLVMISAIAILLVRQIPRVLGASRQEARTLLPAPRRAAPVPPASQIPAQPANVASVTEHTTRNFDPASLKEHDIR